MQIMLICKRKIVLKINIAISLSLFSFFLDNLIPLTILKVKTFPRAFDCVEMFQTFSQRIFEDPRNLSITLVAPDRSDI